MQLRRGVVFGLCGVSVGRNSGHSADDDRTDVEFPDDGSGFLDGVIGDAHHLDEQRRDERGDERR